MIESGAQAQAGRLRSAATTLGGALVGTVVGAVRLFVWAELRENALSLRGLPAGTRSLVWLGFGLTAAVLGILLFNDSIRTRVPLEALPNAVAGRGSLVPVPLVPATLFSIAVAWAFALTGALHAHPAIRIGLVLLYSSMAVNWTGQALVGSLVELALSWGAILLVPVLFAVRWRGRSRPVPEFVALLAPISVTFVALQAQGADTWRVSGVALLLGHLNTEVLSLTLLIMPLLLLFGMGVAGFALVAAGWTVEIAARAFPRWVLWALLPLLAVWRLREVVLEALDRAEASSVDAALLAYLGSFAVLVAVALAWLLIRRAGSAARVSAAPSPDGIAEAADRSALRLIVAFAWLQILGFLLITFGLPIFVLGVVPAQVGPELLGTVVTLLNADLAMLLWRLLVAAVAVGLGVRLARRGSQDLALFLAVFGMTAALVELTKPGRPLGVLAASGGSAALVDFWLVLSFGVVGLVWLARGNLTDARVGRLTLLLLATALLRQTDFISNRFSPFFGSGGVAFLVFAVAWDALTIGGWANRSTAGLPRVSRILLYLGYTLLTVTVVNWAASVHDLTALGRLTGDATLDGLHLFGRPMLYAVFATLLMAPPTDGQPDQPIPERASAGP